MIVGRDWDVGGVRKEVSRFLCGKLGLVFKVLVWYVCLVLFCFFFVFVGCLVVVSLRYRCIVIVGDIEEVGSVI